jgi:predicted phosphodiesterase
MRGDFDMIVREFDRNDDLTIIPISDVHLGAFEHMSDEWERFCENVLKQPNTLLTLGGDLINNATRSSVSNIFSETMRPSEQKKRMAEMLKPLAYENRILCATAGNHEKRSGKDADDDPMYDIMAKLDLEDIYRENMAFVKIRIGDKNGAGDANPTYCLGVTHGAGGGILTGASINRNERFGRVIDGLDALIVGHTHKGAITVPDKILIDKHNNKISLKPFVVMTCVPWLSFGGYALKGMMLPAATGMPQAMKLYGKKKEADLVWKVRW